MALPSRYHSGASQGHLEIGGPHAVTRPGTEGLPQLLFPPGGSKLPVPSQHAGEEETVADDTYHTHGVSLPRPHDQRALLSPQEHLAHRETWNEITVLPLPAPSPPQAALGTNTAEAEPQPLLPTTCCGPPCNARAEHPALQLSPSPKLQGEGWAAGAGIYPPTAGKPRCSPVPHKFVRPLGMEFMRGDSSKEKVPEITA